MTQLLQSKRYVALFVAFIASAITVLTVEVFNGPSVSLNAQGIGTPVACANSVAVSGSTAATAELVALASGKRIYVCGFTLVGAGTSQVKLVTGTGTACATGTADLTGSMSVATATSVTGTGVAVPVSKALCWTNAQAIQVSGVVSYRQF